MTTLQPTPPAMPQQQPYAPQQPPRGWWSRNWKWFVPVGCLTLILMFVGAIALLVMGVFSMLKSNDAYKQGLAAAQNHPALVAELGSPIDATGWPSGSVNVTNNSGKAEFTVGISGPKGDATLYIEGRRRAGQWVVTSLIAEIDGSGKRLDLLAGNSSP